MLCGHGLRKLCGMCASSDCRISARVRVINPPNGKTRTFGRPDGRPCGRNRSVASPALPRHHRTSPALATILTTLPLLPGAHDRQSTAR
jgi:hypothetical protein